MQIKMIADINITGVCGFALLRLISTDSVSVDLIQSVGGWTADATPHPFTPSFRLRKSATIITVTPLGVFSPRLSLINAPTR